MPTYDRRCTTCAKTIEVYERMSEDAAIACMCGGEAHRIISTHQVTSDDIPGGILIEHGICYPDGTPRRYYSKSEMTKAAKKAGLVQGAFMHDSPSGRRWV